MRTIHKHIKNIFSHELINGSVYMFIGTMTLNVCAFIFNLLFARRLSPDNYGIYTSLIALFIIATIPAQPFTTTIVAFASGFFAENDLAREAFLYKKSLIILGVMAIGIGILTLFLSPIILKFLHISDSLLLLMIGFMIGCFYISIIQNAFLQARLQFFITSIFIASGGIIKVLLGALFLVWEFQVYGAIGASVIAIIIPFFLSFYPLRKLLFIREKYVKMDYKKIFLFALPTSCATISLTLLISTDLLLVKHFFSATEAGLYAGISIIGKSIFYFTGSIPLVMFPLLIKRYKKGENVHKLLSLSLFLVIIPSLLATVFFSLYPHVVINLFLGKAIYDKVAGLLWLYGLFITAFSVLNILTLFFLSLQKTKVAYILLLGSLLQMILLSFFHQSFSVIIAISFFLTLSMMLILLLYYLHLYGETKKQEKYISINNSSSIYAGKNNIS